MFKRNIYFKYDISVEIFPEMEIKKFYLFFINGVYCATGDPSNFDFDKG